MAKSFKQLSGGATLEIEDSEMLRKKYQRFNGTPAHLVSLARKHTQVALQQIIKIMMSKKSPPAVKLRAAEILIERGYGKAPQAVLIKQDDGPPQGIGAIPLAVRIESLRNAILNTGDEPLELEASQVSEAPARAEDLV